MARPRVLLDYLNIAAKFLADKDIASARLDAEVLLAHVLQKDRVALYVDFDQPLEEHEVDQYRALLARRANKEPVAYLIKEKEFFSHTLCVTPDVLIPRPETELLVEEVIAWGKTHPNPKIVDVGTGSGAIAIALAVHIPQAHVWAVDISQEALKVAHSNAIQAGVEHRIEFLPGNWLEPLSGRRVDAVVSNPPYIPSHTIQKLQSDVRFYEPHLALDGGADGLEAYRQLTPAAAAIVPVDGRLFFEVGVGQAHDVSRIMQQAGWHVQKIVPDHADIERIVVGAREGTGCNESKRHIGA